MRRYLLLIAGVLFSFAARAQAEYQAESQARAATLAAKEEEYEGLIAENDAQLEAMRQERDAEHAARQEEIAAMQAGSGEISGGADYAGEIADNTASTAGSAGSIEKSLGLAEEDLKSLVDVAEQRYVNRINLTAQTPVINITGANTGNTPADRQRLADQIRDVLVEQWSSGGNMYTNYAVSGA